MHEEKRVKERELDLVRKDRKKVNQLLHQSVMIGICIFFSKGLPIHT